MAVTDTPRFALTQWSAGSDAPVNRAQLTGDNLALDQKAAGWLTDTAANRPAAAAANVGFLFRATDTGALSISNGSAWFPIPTGTYLPTSGGILTGALNLNGQEIQNPIVLQARDKVTTASVSGAVTIDAAVAATHVLTMTGNVSGITVNNLNTGEGLRVIWLQDGTGGRTIAFPNTWKWTGGVSVGGANFKTTANAENYLEIAKVVSTTYAFLGVDMKV